MKTLMLAAGFAALLGGMASAQGIIQHRGYVRQDGTYVAPHVQTAPDHTRLNNWSTYPNVNPYTGRQGYAPVMPMPHLRSDGTYR